MCLVNTLIYLYFYANVLFYFYTREPFVVYHGFFVITFLGGRSEVVVVDEISSNCLEIFI